VLSLPTSVRIFLALEPCDMRRGIDGLVHRVRMLEGELDVYSGHLFVFVSRGRDRIKILSWQSGGFVVVYKRLERGRFKLPRARAGTRLEALDAAALAMLLEGIDYSRVGRPRLWQPQAPSPKGRAA
jgi:transposase